MPAQAVLMRYDFPVTNIDGGIHDSTTGSGYFTFDSEGEELDIDSGEVIKQVLDFEFNWLGQTFGVETLDFEDDGDGVLFANGKFQGLDWTLDDANLSWDLFENEFEYTDLSGFPNVSGYGEVSYEKQISDVPEPGVVMGLGLVGLGFCLNKKKLSHL
ncbi:MAG: PEP-CTERM sorting domain-containing protein [Okeania sp. SIO3I5]|uniref:PEP-CTERM sorting domain-containing protein n=1 Tax=Okeania sp. SIO3I5 TaxID=2607805 RepID=UPI0013B9D341|nr:PEP-CTERM sorting domain-containing protein [Okeania sp. SIO3I5]NEQ35384.1 PEP-CTERM sorting domain-containing protein [Okeania sp. SIO3I5]